MKPAADDKAAPRVAFEREADDGDKRSSQADVLLDLIEAEGVELWKTPAGVLYATMRGERIDHVRVDSTEMRRRLQGVYYISREKALRRESLSEVVGVLEGRALTGPTHEIFVRLAPTNGEIYLDLADAEGRCVRVSPDNWTVESSAPVRFRRPDGMLALPVPERGGNVDLLRPLVNVADSDWPLFVGFLLGTLNPSIPYPVLVVTGEAGSAKSSLARIAVLLLDPKGPPLRRPPREERDLVIAARHGRLLAFNNVSDLREWLSDAFCSIATDGGAAFRALYSNADEERFEERRPVILNGIEDFVVRGDLADRSIRLILPAIRTRKTEAEIMAGFRKVHGRVLGTLLDAASVALRRQADVELQRTPRLADFARWVVAAEPALGWATGTFETAYSRSIQAGSDAVIEDDPVARRLALVVTVEWNGSASDLLALLARDLTEDERRKLPPTWPKSARGVSGRLRRLAPDLRRAGWTVEDAGLDEKSRRQTWRIVPPGGTRPEGGRNPSNASDASDGPQTPRPDATSPEGSGRGNPSEGAPDPSPVALGSASEGSNGSVRRVEIDNPSPGNARFQATAHHPKGPKGPKGRDPYLSGTDAEGYCDRCGGRASDAHECDGGAS